MGSDMKDIESIPEAKTFTENRFFITFMPNDFQIADGPSCADIITATNIAERLCVVPCLRGYAGKRHGTHGVEYLGMEGQWCFSFGGPPETVVSQPYATREAAASGIEAAKSQPVASDVTLTDFVISEAGWAEQMDELDRWSDRHSRRDFGQSIAEKARTAFEQHQREMKFLKKLD